MTAPDERLRNVETLLAQAGRGLGLRVCFYDRLELLPELPLRWRTHTAPFCRRVKRRATAACKAFHIDEVYPALCRLPAGRVHTCPFGVTELVVPVMTEGIAAGMLSAGPCRLGDGPPPSPERLAVRGKAWLRDRLVLLRGVALQLAAMLRPAPETKEGERRSRILRHLHDHVAEPFRIEALAADLSLSPSRARHVARRVFHVPPSKLAHDFKLREAAHLLRTTDVPVKQVAARTGYLDPNYFCRLFRRAYDSAPLVYRNRHTVNP